MKQAVIAIGSNSTRMLIRDGDAERRFHRDTMLHKALDERGFLSRAGMDAVVAAVADFSALAQAAGAGAALVLATAATRKARNRQDMLDAIAKKTGLAVRVLSGEEESAYAFDACFGALLPGRIAGVIDIGGGSTELYISDGDRVYVQASVPLGANALEKLRPIDGAADAAAARAVFDKALRNVLQEAEPLPDIGEAVLLGGTGVTMQKVLQGLSWQSETEEGFLLSEAQARNALDAVLAHPRSERTAVVGLAPTRTDVFPAGSVIVLSVMEALRVPHVRVSNKTNMDGALNRLQKGLT